jgi:hypothetical protein
MAPGKAMGLAADRAWNFSEKTAANSALLIFRIPLKCIKGGTAQRHARGLV